MSGGTPWKEGMHFNHLIDMVNYILPVTLSNFYRVLIFTYLAGLFSYLFFKSLGFSVLISVILNVTNELRLNKTVNLFTTSDNKRVIMNEPLQIE